MSSNNIKNKQTIEDALSNLDASLQPGPDAPRTNYELVQATETAIASGLKSKPEAVFVPDAEGPTTPAVKEEQIRLPAVYIEPEARTLSLRAKSIIQNLLSLMNESTRIQTGLQNLVQKTASKVTNAKALVSASTTGWMRSIDNFQDESRIDPSSSQDVNVNVNTGGGVTMSPTSEQDLSPNVAALSIVVGKSNGLPGDNLELSSIQDLPGNSSPAAGSFGALASTKQVVGSSGGSGQEPTVTYSGYPSLHTQLSVVLTDSNDYFDYERVVVPPIQPCTKQGTAYVYDETSGSTVDVRTVTQNYGWTATVTNQDGSQSTGVPLVSFEQYPPGTPGVTPGPNDTLTLNLELDFGTEIEINQLEISVKQSGGLWPTISGVEISLDHNNWFALRCQGGGTSWTGDAPASSASQITTQNISSGLDTSVANGNSARLSSIWEIPSYAGSDQSNAGFPKFRYVNIAFTQKGSYQCPKGVGHPYYVEVVNDQKKSKGAFGGLFGGNHSSNTTTVTRYPGPEAIINVSPGVLSHKESNPGAAIGGALGTIGGDLIVANNPALGSTGLVGVVAQAGAAIGSFLFGNSSETKTVTQAGEYNDVFNAFRQAISLVRVMPVVRNYPTGKSSQLVSQPINFNSPFTAIRLYVDDMIPNGTQITYDISVDDGKTWQNIQPFDMGAITTPYISPSQTLTLKSPANSLRFRASFSTTQQHCTPRLLGYLIEALPQVQ